MCPIVEDWSHLVAELVEGPKGEGPQYSILDGQHSAHSDRPEDIENISSLNRNILTFFARFLPQS